VPSPSDKSGLSHYASGVYREDSNEKKAIQGTHGELLPYIRAISAQHHPWFSAERDRPRCVRHGPRRLARPNRSVRPAAAIAPRALSTTRVCVRRRATKHGKLAGQDRNEQQNQADPADGWYPRTSQPAQDFEYDRGRPARGERQKAALSALGAGDEEACSPSRYENYLSDMRGTSSHVIFSSDAFVSFQRRRTHATRLSSRHQAHHGEAALKAPCQYL